VDGAKFHLKRSFDHGAASFESQVSEYLLNKQRLLYNSAMQLQNYTEGVTGNNYGTSNESSMIFLAQ
jgi:hypothetical protein